MTGGRGLWSSINHRLINTHAQTVEEMKQHWKRKGSTYLAEESGVAAWQGQAPTKAYYRHVPREAETHSTRATPSQPKNVRKGGEKLVRQNRPWTVKVDNREAENGRGSRLTS
jgi:hypothetical protein